MEKIILLVETGADVPAELAKELGIEIVPMHVEMNGVTLDDGTFPVENILDYYKDGHKLPKTSGSTPFDFEVMFDRLQGEHPDAKIHIFDTLSAGPEMAMVTEKIVELLNKGLPFEEIVAGVREYQNHCHTLFCLECMNNLARNGRVNPAVAKIASVLGIRACGDAQNGQIIPTQKPRGQKKATETLVSMIRERGFTNSSWLRIAHCFGENQAQLLIDALKKDFPDARYTVEPTGVLCSFYAEEGGLMIAMEGGFNQVNNVNDI